MLLTSSASIEVILLSTRLSSVLQETRPARILGMFSIYGPQGEKGMWIWIDQIFTLDTMTFHLCPLLEFDILHTHGVSASNGSKPLYWELSFATGVHLVLI